MLSLIGREIRDHLFYVLAPCFISLIMIGMAIRAFLSGIEPVFFFALTILMSLPLLLFCVLGSVQMYADRANEVSAFLSTLAVTRNRILAAKFIVGALTILATVAPLFIAARVLLGLFSLGADFYCRMVAGVSVTIALAGFACYCVGLLVGWTTHRAWLLGGGLLLLALTLSLVPIKGFGPDATAILLLVIGVMLVRIWHKFTSTSL